MFGTSLSFARPDALWLLLIVPVVAIAGFRFGRKRSVRRSTVALRALAILLLCLAIAEPLVSASDTASSTVFIVDQSSSIDDSTSSTVTQWVNDALESGGSSDRAAVIGFGASPELVQTAGEVDQISADGLGSSTVDDVATNIESALSMARSLPMSGDRRLVLVSDGAENSGSSINQASELAADQVPVDVLPVAGIGSDDFRIDGIAVPSSVWIGEPATVLLSVASSTETTGTVEVQVDDNESEVHEVTFGDGLSSHSFSVNELEPGFHSLHVRIVADQGNDAYFENNQTSSSLVVRATPALLLVSAERADSSYLIDALETRGALVTPTSPSGIPERLSDLSVYDVVVLNNVPAAELTVGQVAALDSLTREFGRGLVVIGGSSSYGPGGYAETALEKLLPVSVKVTEGKERQRVALMLIIDKSGSMAYDPLQTSSKIDMAKEAVRLAAGALADGDEIGILVFNDKQQWIIRLTQINDAADRDRINTAIELITADGGTEIYPALEVGFDEIAQSDADVRHVVLLSDGKSSTGTRESYEKLIEEFQASDTTLSTIAIGDDADTDLLQFLAERGNGNYHPTERPEDVPMLTLAEAESAGSQSIINGAFQPVQIGASPIMTTFPPESLPAINRYDFSEAKTNGQVILASAREDPLLAKWQYGLGRVVAWTADDGIDFAADWRSWDRYGEFWMSVVRWSLPDPENGPVTVDVDREGSEAVVTVQTQSVVGDYVDLSTALVDITSPSGALTEDLSLYQSAPGEYQMRIADPEPGAYRFELAYGNLQADQTALAGFSIPASPELQPSAASEDLLASIAARTNGRTLSLEDPGAVFSAPEMAGDGIPHFRPVWWIPLLAALAIFLIELASRYQFTSQFARFRNR